MNQEHKPQLALDSLFAKTTSVAAPAAAASAPASSMERNPLGKVLGGLLPWQPAVANPSKPGPSLESSSAKKDLQEQGAHLISLGATTTVEPGVKLSEKNDGTDKGVQPGQTQGHAPAQVNWADKGDLPPDLDGKIKDYNIHSVQKPDGTIVITSNGIRVEVKPMGSEFDKMFAGKTPQQVDQMVQQWRDKKNKDDQLSYGQSTADLREKSKEQKYYGSEQHMVWAMAASARTGGRIPPEYFLTFDPFGGTAGQGPEVQPGGDSGQPLSTIAMAHDTDWSLGRYMNVGPLSGLSSINPTEKYQARRMGMAGLFSSGEAKTLDKNAWSAPYFPALNPALQPRADTDAQIDKVLDAAADPDKTMYRGYNRYWAFDRANDTLNPKNPGGWNVQYTKDYAKDAFGPQGAYFTFGQAGSDPFVWDGKDAASGDAVRDLNKQYAPGYR